MCAEAPAQRSAVFRHPVASELEEVIHIVRVYLRPDEDVPRHVEANARSQVHLKVI